MANTRLLSDRNQYWPKPILTETNTANKKKWKNVYPKCRYVALFLLSWRTLFELFLTLKWPESFLFFTLQGTVVITVFVVIPHPLFKCLKFLPRNCFSNVEMYTNAIVILLPFFQHLIILFLSQEPWFYG